MSRTESHRAQGWAKREQGLSALAGNELGAGWRLEQGRSQGCYPPQELGKKSWWSRPGQPGFERNRLTGRGWRRKKKVKLTPEFLPPRGILALTLVYLSEYE